MAAPLAEFLIAFIAAGVLVRAFASAVLAGIVMDLPNDRSLHAQPTPRTGGLGLLAGAGIAWAFSTHASLDPAVGLVAILAAAFFIDDVRGLSAALRLTLQASAAVAFLYWGPLHGGVSSLSMGVLVAGIVWCMNAYNFMDGANGLAGGMAVFGFGGYAAAAQVAGAADLAATSAALGGAALGFLLWNFDPARIFLGDAGSIALGFLAAAIGLLGWQRSAWPPWFPLLVFSPFLLDATATLLRRLLSGESILRAHKAHYYQRLVRMGWSHRRLALFAYVLMTAVVGSALLARDAATWIVVLLLSFWGVAYVLMAIVIDQRSSILQPVRHEASE